MLLGAFAQSLPDIDFIAALWLSPADNLMAHRGFSHSILFALLASLMCAWLAERWYKQTQIELGSWIIFFSVQIFLHLVIDVMNAYGVGLLEPFSHHRFSFNILFVADPLFTIAPFIAALALVMLPSSNSTRKTWVALGLLPCVIYFSIAVSNKLSITGSVKKTLDKKLNLADDYFTTPTPLNIFLWYIVAKTDGGYYLGYGSIFDRTPIELSFVAKNDSLLAPIQARHDVERLKTFSQDYYIVSQTKGKLYFSDLRFGQAFGWIDPNAPFIFKYELDEANQNMMVLQKGRFSNWNSENVKASLKRLRGKK